MKWRVSSCTNHAKRCMFWLLPSVPPLFSYEQASSRTLWLKAFPCKPCKPYVHVSTQECIGDRADISKAWFLSFWVMCRAHAWVKYHHKCALIKLLNSPCWKRGSVHRKQVLMVCGLGLFLHHSTALGAKRLSTVWVYRACPCACTCT